MHNNEYFQNIDENDDNFVSKDYEKEEEKYVNTFVLGLPDWDLEPLYESVKRGGKE